MQIKIVVEHPTFGHSTSHLQLTDDEEAAVIAHAHANTQNFSDAVRDWVQAKLAAAVG